MTRRVLSCRHSKMKMSRGLTFEFEDAIADCDHHVRINTTSVPTEQPMRRRWRARKTAQMILDPRTSPGGDELVFAVAQVLPDLGDHLAFQREVQSAHKKAAFVEEVWVKDIPLRLDVRRQLAQFDHVFVSCAGTVEALAEHIDTPVTYLPPSIDHERFAAHPWPPLAIDVYAMGRRQPELHEALLRWVAADPSRFYMYDTVTGNRSLRDHRQHRGMLAQFVRRSRYFMVSGAKFNCPDETGNQAELGYRYFEGAAAGAVMLGTEVTAPTFPEQFTWEEPILTVDPSGHDLADRIDELDADPDRRAAIRQRNAAGSLRAHDPAHRWRLVLATLELEEPPGVEERIGRLAQRANQIDFTDIERRAKRA